MNPTPEEQAEALTDPKPVAGEVQSYLRLLRESQERKVALLHVEDELRKLREKHAAALMEFQTQSRRAEQVRESLSNEALQARGYAAVLARALLELLACGGPDPEGRFGREPADKWNATAEDARAALAQWDDWNC